MYFKLTLRLLTPFYLDGRLTLDGLLSSAIYRRTGKMGAETRPLIPLDRDEVSDIFRGSSLFCHPHYQHAPVWRVNAIRTDRHLSTELYQPNRRGGRYGAIDTARGDYVTELDSYDGLHAQEVYFWGSGDGEQCQALIENYVVGIGKRASTGAGAIESVRLDEIDTDLSWVTAGGQPARPLPVEIWQTLGLAEKPAVPMAVTVPYWGDEQVLAVFPTNWIA